MGSNTKRIQEPHHAEQSTGGVHFEQIKAAVRMSGTTLARVSVDGGLNPEACSWALRHPWPRAERLIADAIGTEPWLLWPDRYDHNCKPLRGKPVPARRAKRSARPSEASARERAPSCGLSARVAELEAELAEARKPSGVTLSTAWNALTALGAIVRGEKLP